MKTRTVYIVELKKQYGSEFIHLQPHEFGLIRTMLNAGERILSVTKEEVTPQRFRYLFG